MNTENCDCVSDHIPISFSSPEILHATMLVLKHSAYPVLNAPELYLQFEMHDCEDNVS